MPQIPTSNPDLIDLQGLHLWHAGLSSCSQRVRLALAELKLPFESHVVNLHAGENATDWYQAIHPNGVVPALVHDGRLLIESVDIIDYLNQTLGGGSLAPVDSDASKRMLALMQRADRAQKFLKTLTFEYLFRAAPAMHTEVAENYQRNHRNEMLKAFHRDFHAGFGVARIREAATETDSDFRFLEETLGNGREFLLGSIFSLADIAWIPNFHRFELIGWPFERYPALKQWFARVSARPSYATALKAWEPTEMLDIAAPLLKARQAAGDGIENYVNRISSAAPPQ